MIFIHPEQHSKNIMQTKMRSFNKKEKNIEHLGKYPNTLTREWVLFMQQQSSLKEDQMSNELNSSKYRFLSWQFPGIITYFFNSK